MARPTLFSNRKFAKLSQRLQSRALALGHLEFIWAAANETGNPIIGDADDVEAVADWRGDRGELVSALLEAGSNGGPGFIVATVDNLYEIHDYWHHAPDYVRKRAKREAQRRDTGDSIRNGSTSDRSNNGHDPPIDRSLTGQNAVASPKKVDFFRTPAPAPAPAPKEEENPPTPLRGGPGSLARSGRKPRDIRTASNAAWANVIEGAQRSYQRKAFEKTDPVLAMAIDKLGGWNRFGHSTAIGTLKAPFRELYEQLLEASLDEKRAIA